MHGIHLNAIRICCFINIATKYQVIEFSQGVPDLSDFGDAYDVEFGLGKDQPPTSAMVKKNLQRKIIYHMSPNEVNSVWQVMAELGYKSPLIT